MSQILIAVRNVSEMIRTGGLPQRVGPTQLESLLAETDSFTNPLMIAAIRQYSDRSLWSLLEYAVANKRHNERAYAVRLGCEAVGEDWKGIGGALASVELRYSSLVVTDDVFDQTAIRMNKPTVARKWGNNLAITAAAILKSLSTTVLVESFMNRNLPPNIFREVVLRDEASFHAVYQGQYSDLISEEMRLNDVSDDFLLDMVKNTTGVDVGYCTCLGSILGNGNPKQTSAMYDFGVGLGTAMQIRDDFIDFVDSDSMIDKSPFTDVERGKKRFPLVVAYRFASDDVKKELDQLLNKGSLTSAEKERLTEIVLDDRVVCYIDEVFRQIKERTAEKLREVTDSVTILSAADEIMNDILVLT